MMVIDIDVDNAEYFVMQQDGNTVMAMGMIPS